MGTTGESAADPSSEALIRNALELGVSDARWIEAEKIVVHDRFPQLCASPRCPGYDTSPLCPPHVMEVDAFREILSGYRRVLVFRIDAPTRILMSDDRMEVAGLVHEMSARIEILAVETGFPRARAFAAGACKQIFCADEARCIVLAEGAPCPFEDRARPSMSGVGVDFKALSRALKWQGQEIIGKETPGDVDMSFMTGIVLVD
ncbi:MAG: DUF2284 domain-containing protein [Planctomycetota bacterium]